MNIRQSSSLPFTRLAVPRPQHIRPALSRLGAWARLGVTRMEGASSNQSLPPTQLHTQSRISPSPSSSSSWDSTAGAQEFVIDAGVETRPPGEKDPLPAFLRQTKGEIHAKFVDLEWQQRERLHLGDEDAENSDSRWSRLTGDEVSKRN